MGDVHFIGGEKGGVGKSLTARVLAQYFIDRDVAFTGFDLDHSHATFSRFYGEFTSPILVSDFASLDSMLEVAEENPKQNLILDLAAQTSRFLDEWIEQSDVFGIFAELGFRPFLWHVMDDGADSLRLLSRLLETYDDQSLTFVVVMNFGRGEDFEFFKASDAYAELTQRGGKLIELPKLETRLSQKVDFNNSSFWAAANNRQIMSLVERKRVAVWLNAIYAQLDGLLGSSKKLAE